MANPKLPREQADEALRVLKECGGSYAKGAAYLRLPEATFRHRVRIARIYGSDPSMAPETGEPVTPKAHREGVDTTRDVRLSTATEEANRFKSAYKKLIEEQVDEERLIQMFRTSIARFPKLPAHVLGSSGKRPVEQPSTVREVPVLVRGDQQIGEEITHEETFGINRYNFQVYQQRLAHLEERVLDLLLHHQRRKFDQLIVPYMGDNVSGVIHDELQKYGNQHIVDQVYLGALCEALFLYRLKKIGGFKTIVVPCISGNHGRLSEKKEFKRYYKNFDYLFHSIMALALKDVEGIVFQIPRCLFMVQDVAGKRLLLSHGHELPPSSLGIPLYSINRASANYQELLSATTAGRFDYWLLAHFHRPLELDNAIVNGTMAGLAEMGIGRFKPIRPMQRLIGFTDRWGKSWEYPVWLEQAPDTQSVYTFGSDMAPGDAMQTFAEQIKNT